ncbi:MAG TPA: TetR family transcriptional regulator [Micrococcales bacterium]|uniref:TetR/AcrR family transcriptional regulator n=1 Tax=Miniimonas arenae TaxID=676201 RepID=UPI000EDE4290|nr:helix-turn-helix domain-containing protein [Miniimonas arenae]HCX85527.1 TetR family transcriptional regulator [Micrococcales bacterium]
MASRSDTPTPEGPRARATRLRRETILDAALELFGEVGFRAASLREIAARAEISHPGVIYHFATKEELLLAVLERRDADVSERFHLESSDGVTVLRNFVALADVNAHNRLVVELYVTVSAEATDPSHPAHDYFVDRYTRVVTSARTALADLQGRGLLVDPDLDLDLAARELVAVIDGLQLQWLLHPGQVRLADGVRAHLRRIATIDV